MKLKRFELQHSERGFVYVIAVKLHPATDAEQYLLNGVGFTKEYMEENNTVVLTELKGGESRYDPETWEGDTTGNMKLFHSYIRDNWDSLEEYSTLDIDFLKGKKKEKPRPFYLDFLEEEAN